MVIALVVVFILFCGLTDGRLLYAQNMSNLMLQNGYVLVLACGMLLCILTGGNIDLSVGAVICMVGGLAAVMIGNKGMNPYLTIIICLVVGLLVGVWQGYWIGYKRIPPFITTLAGMFIFRGFGRLILDNKTVSIKDKGFLNVFTSYINIPGLDDTANYSALLKAGSMRSRKRRMPWHSFRRIRRNLHWTICTSFREPHRRHLRNFLCRHTLLLADLPEI